MMRLYPLPLLLALAACAAPAPEVEPFSPDPVRAVLAAQQAAWNEGNIEEFVTGYLDSDETLFVGSEVLRGTGPLLERYKRTYPGPEGMGQLEFSDLEVWPVGDEHARVLGRYHLTREAQHGGEASGTFTLLFVQTPDGWKILQDHTSADAPPTTE